MSGTAADPARILSDHADRAQGENFGLQPGTSDGAGAAHLTDAGNVKPNILFRESCQLARLSFFVSDTCRLRCRAGDAPCPPLWAAVWPRGSAGG